MCRPRWARAWDLSGGGSSWVDSRRRRPLRVTTIPSPPAFTHRFLITGGPYPASSEPVPDGFRWVLRCVDFRIDTPLSGSYYTLAVQPWAAYITSGFFDTQPHVQWTGRQVLEAGETLSVELSGPGYVFATGYQLALS